MRYRFNLPNGLRETFDLFFEDGDFRLLNPVPKARAVLGRTQFQPLRELPVARPPRTRTARQPPSSCRSWKRSRRLVSYDEIRVDVLTAERSITQTTTAQQALASLFGLILSSSGCPRTAFLQAHGALSPAARERARNAVSLGDDAPARSAFSAQPRRERRRGFRGAEGRLRANCTP